MVTVNRVSLNELKERLSEAEARLGMDIETAYEEMRQGRLKESEAFHDASLYHAAIKIVNDAAERGV